MRRLAISPPQRLLVVVVTNKSQRPAAGRRPIWSAHSTPTPALAIAACQKSELFNIFATQLYLLRWLITISYCCFATGYYVCDFVGVTATVATTIIAALNGC